MDRKTRLPAIGRFRSARAKAKMVDTASRRKDREALSDRVSMQREKYMSELCAIAEDVNQMASAAHRMLADCYTNRMAMSQSQKAALLEHQTYIREEAERIVTSDFR